MGHATLRIRYPCGRHTSVVRAVSVNQVEFQVCRGHRPAARWGVVLEAIGYSLLWQGEFWARAPAEWRVAVSILFFTIACFFSWTGTRALGRHLRLDAALNPDHELVRSGPYRVIRHPIYASMLCVLLGTGFLVARWALLIAGVLVFIAGTEIRVRIEEKLLASRFGDEFLEYRRGVPAYIPLIR